MRIRDLIKIILISFFIVLIFGLISARQLSVELLAIFLEITIFGFLMIKMDISKENFKDTIKNFRLNLNLRELIGRYINVHFLNIGVSFLFIGIFIIIDVSVLNQMLIKYTSDIIYTGNTFISLLSIVILSPVLEEIIYRKIIFKRLSQKLNISWGIILSSIMFGISHSMDSMFFATMYGIVFCILYIKYNNILVPMALHFFNNAFSVLLSLNSRNTLQQEKLFFIKSEGNLYVIMGILVVTLGGFFFIKYIYNNKSYLVKYETSK